MEMDQMMEKRLREYMDDVFSDIRPTRKSVELKEEILQNLIDKYYDLVAEGKSPEAAYQIAIAGIGDMNELLAVFREENQEAESTWEEECERDRRRSAGVTAVAVMLYITSVIPPILFSALGEMSGNPFLEDVLGPVLMFVIIAAATGMLIYRNMTRPRYRDTDETIVDEFRQWQEQKDKKKKAGRSIKSAVRSLMVVFYLFISFTTGAWHITWIIFLLGGAIERMVQAIIDLQ